jgi:hypothetical protein
MTYQPGSVTIELIPQQWSIFDIVNRWPNMRPPEDNRIPLTSHFQAAEAAQDMYPSTDKAVVTHHLDGSYEVQLFCNRTYQQTIMFHP